MRLESSSMISARSGPMLAVVLQESPFPKQIADIGDKMVYLNFALPLMILCWIMSDILVQI